MAKAPTSPNGTAITRIVSGSPKANVMVRSGPIPRNFANAISLPRDSAESVITWNSTNQASRVNCNVTRIVEACRIDRS